MPSRLVGCFVALLLAGAALGGCVGAAGPTPTPPPTIAPAPTAIAATPSATPTRTVPPASPTTAPTRAATVTVATPTVPPPAPTAASGKPPALGESFVLRPGQSAAVVEGPRIAFTACRRTRAARRWSTASGSAGRCSRLRRPSPANRRRRSRSRRSIARSRPTGRPTPATKIRLASVQPRRARPDDPMPLGDYRAELVVTRVGLGCSYAELVGLSVGAWRPPCPYRAASGRREVSPPRPNRCATTPPEHVHCAGQAAAG